MEEPRKECSKCHQAKLLTEFYRNKTKPDGLSSLCKVCQENPSYRVVRRVIDGKKECSICHIPKLLNEFSPKERGIGGVASRCNTCAAQATGAWRGKPGNRERGNQKTLEWLENPDNKERHKQTMKGVHDRIKKDPIRREKRRQSVRKRRAKKKGLPQIDTVDLAVLYIRDKGICSICGKHVNMKLKAPDPGSPSIDHIIPVTKPGSTESYQNTALAHLGCNLKKGNRSVPQQQRLF